MQKTTPLVKIPVKYHKPALIAVIGKKAIFAEPLKPGQDNQKQENERDTKRYVGICFAL